MDKRTFLKITGAAGAGLVLAPWAGCATSTSEQGATELDVFGADTFVLPALGFETAALAPAMGSTMLDTCGN